MGFDSPDDLNRFIKLLSDELESAGNHDAAARLAAVQDSACTTGSEWLGELGTAVKAIRNAGTLPAAFDKKLDLIMKEVRRVWRRL
jgi:hypothetical protein